MFNKLSFVVLLGMTLCITCDADPVYVWIDAERTIHDTKDECPMKDIGIPGNDVAHVTNIDKWEDCGKACIANPKCLFWEYQLKNKHCYMKNSDSTKKHESTKISGSRDCALALAETEKKRGICMKSFKCYGKGYWNHSGLGSVQVRDLEDCKKKCCDTSGCNAVQYTWAYDSCALVAATKSQMSWSGGVWDACSLD